MPDYLQSVTRSSTKAIYEQMDKSIFKVIDRDKNYDIGYFCYITCENNKKVPVVIINNWKIAKENNKHINISLNGKIKTSRTPSYPEEWAHQFGVSLKEHQENLHINLFEGYVVFDIEDEGRGINA